MQRSPPLLTLKQDHRDTLDATLPVLARTCFRHGTHATGLLSVTSQERDHSRRLRGRERTIISREVGLEENDGYGDANIGEVDRQTNLVS